MALLCSNCGGALVWNRKSRAGWSHARVIRCSVPKLPKRMGSGVAL